MNGLMNNFVDNTVQCWGCPVFDRLFQIVSDAAAVVYEKFAFLCAVLFCVLFAFFLLGAVWQNIKKGLPDPYYQKSVLRVVINSAVALTLLGIGVALPRFITTVSFEPAAQIALNYTQSMLTVDNEHVEQQVVYTPMKMSDDGFYRPQLRDTIIMLMKTTITQFQSYMKLGLAVMDKAFTWNALLGAGALIRHILIFIIGMYLFYGFFKLFLKFCFCFADIIVAMAFFAFFFPLSLMLMSFKGADDMPKWISGLGKNIGADRFKSLINSIITLAATVLTYTVIMVVIAKFFSDPDASAADLMHQITTGQVFAADLSDDNLAALTLMGAVVLVYVINFLYAQIPQVTSMVLSAFNVKTESELSNKLAQDAATLTQAVLNTAKSVGKTIISGGEKEDKKKDDKKADGKK